jgi:hypothetical protein
VKPIQFILITLLTGLGMIYLSRLRSTLIKRVAVLAFAGLGIGMVIMPDMTNRFAALVGVGRGADLLLYLGFVGSVFVFLLLYVRVRTLETDLTELARSVAISSAHEPARPDAEGSA